MSFFVEVGACDFDTCEQLIHNGWKGIVIEPVKHYYDKLTKYPQIHYENIAISDQEGESEIHFINPEHIVHENQQWLKGISSLEGATGPLSFEENQTLTNFQTSLKQKVKTFTLNQICEKYDIHEIDFLKIDTEGHDLIVLQSIDLQKVHVKMIKIEHKHLNKDDIMDHLKQHNYLCYLEKDDIYAIK